MPQGSPEESSLPVLGGRGRGCQLTTDFCWALMGCSQKRRSEVACPGLPLHSDPGLPWGSPLQVLARGPALRGFQGLMRLSQPGPPGSRQRNQQQEPPPPRASPAELLGSGHWAHRLGAPLPLHFCTTFSAAQATV